MNLQRALTKFLAVACCLCLSRGAALAVPLSDLFQGATITADDKIFRDWTLLNQEVNNGIINLTQIDVTPLIDDPLNPGVKFTAPVDGIGTLFGHGGGAFARLRFSFAVQTASGLPLIKDNSLLINGWIFDSGPLASITISETVRNAAGAALGTKSVVARPGDQPGSGDPDHFDSADFAPQSIVVVEKFIDIVGPGMNDGARLTMFEQRFSQVPEPSGMALASAVLACGLATRRRRRRQV
jgi:hypothetical protein